MKQKGISLRQGLHYLTLAPRIEWRRPADCDVLIFDRVGADVLRQALPDARIGILDVRGESVNLPILVRSMFNFLRGNQRLSLANQYIDEYIRTGSPKLAITFIDNNPSFYSLHSRHPKLKTAFVQNGVRDTEFDLFSHLQRHRDYYVDRMYTFSAAMGQEYLKRIAGTAVPIGSVKNNAVKVMGDTSRTNKRVIWVSQWINGFEPDGKFSRHDADCVRAVFHWCNGRKLKLCVLGRDQTRSSEEYSFFRQVIGSDEFEFVPAGKANAYSEVDRAFLIVSVDSTLGYEALARGKRVAFFCYRSTVYENPSLNFGWPTPWESEGDIWTSSTLDLEWNSLLSRVADFCPSDWDEICDKFKKIMVWDPGNTILKRDILNLLT